jgi:hypothetical protein
MKNFHLPLPDAAYDELRAEAKRTRLSATALARQAVESWLRERRRAARAQALADYAARHGGSELDLDPELERASLECLAGSEE